LTASDTSNKKYRFIQIKEKRRIAPYNKGTINFSLSIPVTTIFKINTINGQYESVGIFGLETGLDYYYKYNRYIAINIGAGTDVMTNTIFASARDNFVLRKLNLGYGISLSKFLWNEYSNDTSKAGYSHQI
jgi:hypothetical protein